MSAKLPGLTLDEHSFCSSALARIQNTCERSEHLRHRTAGVYLRKLILRTERLRQRLLTLNGYTGYARQPFAPPLEWSELCTMQNAVVATLNGKVPAKILDRASQWERSGFRPLLHMSDQGLIELQPPFRK
jgi:hypothetical protein